MCLTTNSVERSQLTVLLEVFQWKGIFSFPFLSCGDPLLLRVVSRVVYAILFLPSLQHLSHEIGMNMMPWWRTIKFLTVFYLPDRFVSVEFSHSEDDYHTIHILLVRHWQWSLAKELTLQIEALGMDVWVTHLLSISIFVVLRPRSVSYHFHFDCYRMSHVYKFETNFINIPRPG